MAPKGTGAAGVQPLIESAQRRLEGLQRELHASTDNIGRQNRELQRLELYTSVVKRLNSGDALMPEVAQSQVRPTSR